MNHLRYHRTASAAAIIATCAVVLAGCGSASSGSGAAGQATTSATSAGASSAASSAASSGASSAPSTTASASAPSAATPSSGGGAKGGSVGVSLIVKTDTNPFFIAMEKGAKAAAAKLGVSLTLAAGKKDGDDATQIQAIENAISKGDKGILITPTGPGVYNSIKKARAAGLYVIALDTAPTPASVVDITFATDNFAAGKLDGQWAAKTLGGKAVTIAMLDAFSDQVVSVDVNRDHGFLTGMGIDPGPATTLGKEAKSGSYTGGKYSIACHAATNGDEADGRTAMENCLSKSPDINVVYAINEPAANGAYKALKAAGKTALIVAVDGGCPGVKLVKSGVIGATAQQYPVKMAQLGVQAIDDLITKGTKPAVTPGLDFFNTGTALVTDKPAAGVDSIPSDQASSICWG